MIKCIGFDTTETHRTFATSGENTCPEPGLPAYSDRYDFSYPLRDWGLDRQACGKIIVDAGLPLPPKSACFFCPAMKVEEIAALKNEDPVLYALALEMERLYREGRHFRGDSVFTITAKHRQTGEIEKLSIHGTGIADVRDHFRRTHDDTVKPYRYDLSIHRAVPGLGREFAWTGLSLPVLGD